MNLMFLFDMYFWFAGRALEIHVIVPLGIGFPTCATVDISDSDEINYKVRIRHILFACFAK